VNAELIYILLWQIGGGIGHDSYFFHESLLGKYLFAKMKHRLSIRKITTLIIPGWNDSEDEIGDIARFIKNDLGAETPWHVSAFYPTHRLTDAPRSPHSTLHRARQIGIDEGLRYVYEGNIPGSDGENTYCYNCKKLIIRRYGYSIIEYNIEDGFCKYCNATIDGIGL